MLDNYNENELKPLNFEERKKKEKEEKKIRF